MGQDVRYLLFDVESVPDGELIAKTRYGSRNWNAEEAIGRFRQELLLKSGRDFIPYTFHIPVAVVVAKVRADFELLDIVSLDVPQHRSHVITQHFWAGWEMGWGGEWHGVGGLGRMARLHVLCDSKISI